MLSRVNKPPWHRCTWHPRTADAARAGLRERRHLTASRGEAHIYDGGGDARSSQQSQRRRRQVREAAGSHRMPTLR